LDEALERLEMSTEGESPKRRNSQVKGQGAGNISYKSKILLITSFRAYLFPFVSPITNTYMGKAFFYVF
jgi:hypothetical protein